MKHPLSSSSKGRATGFTLIEIAIAVGILAVALVALIGLLPGGMTNFRKAMDTSVTAQIAQRILLDMQQADYDTLVDTAEAPVQGASLAGYSFTAPRWNTQQFRYFDEQGTELLTSDGTTLTTAQKAALVYVVNVRITPIAPQPALSTVSGAVSLVTVQVARNPTNHAFPVARSSSQNAAGSYQNLFDPTSAVIKNAQIYTYSALIGMNQG
jgi:uncharacterized protein (TIGR02598 family)